MFPAICFIRKKSSDFSPIYGVVHYNISSRQLRDTTQERARMKDEYSLGLLQQDKFKKGKKEGLKEGQQQKALETARKMLADGLDSATVMKYTGLSPDELAALSSK
ncbi:hypothetical protein BGP_3204 [Beggiatoa sp. PS]|nr:hypothetical protein BGP_3204 [Beggiatoa sp. PS]